ncbi:MAG: hypothetical protein UX64_C0021G0006 [Microgenomates group bacterium GW2011_GWC2_46_7]|nr:MAG: hypothetical protein UX64_C0021G0006 [Microgenomates group bacterium GW2011_GWC2_46_7]
MAEIFTRGASKIGGKVERKSILDLKKVVQLQGARHLFTSFATFPPSVVFETQDDGESVVVFLRQHPIVNLPWIVGALLMLTLPSVFGFFPPYANLPVGYQFVVTSGWYLFVTGFVLAKFMGWFFNIYLITDERVVDVDFLNIFFRKISTAKIQDIQDVNVTSSGAMETFFGYGNVFIQTAAEVSQFEFLAVPKPDVVGKILNRMIDLEEQEQIEGRVK